MVPNPEPNEDVSAEHRPPASDVAKEDQASVDDLTATIKPGLYGWGSFTPRFLQVFNKPQWLLACFSFAIFSSTLAGALMPAVIGTLERRFHMSSVESGVLGSSYDIASLLIVIFVCHYGERGHKGRWISVGAIVYGIGSFIWILPHYVGEKFQPSDTDYAHNATCPLSYPQELCTAENLAKQTSSTAYYFFLAGQFIRGFGATCLGTLMLSYVDENVSQRSSPMYLSILSVVGLIAMALGYLTGGEFLHLYGDFDTVPKEKWPEPSDPNYYGCWWIGYYIAGVSAFMIAVPLFGFPKELPSKLKARQLDRQQAHDDDKSEERITGTGFAENWKQIPRQAISLCKNPVFTCFTIRSTMEIMFAAGWGVFMPKYLQNMYGMDPGFSSMITGLICLGPIMIGTLFGGWIIKKHNWKVRGVLAFGFVTTVAGSFASLSVLFTCKTSPIAGANIDYSGNIIPKDQSILWDSCNRNCSCSTADYIPVCSPETGITYYSPCFAGCRASERIGDTIWYTDCECIQRHFSSMNANNSVMNGECVKSQYCITQRNWFIGFWVLTCLLFGMSGMPLVQGFLRAVPFKNRTIALGLHSIPLRLLGTIPGPILMGMMFDYSCILWRKYCDKNLSCLHYDNQTIVMLLLYQGVTYRVLSGALLLLAIILYRPPKEKSKSTDGNAENITSESIGTDTGALNEEIYEGSILDIVVDRLRKRWRGEKIPKIN